MTKKQICMRYACLKNSHLRLVNYGFLSLRKP